jgi:hypothetical protein
VTPLRRQIGGHIALERRDLGRRLQRFGRREVGAGSPQLRERFRVLCDDETLAARVLDERVCAWLVAEVPECHFDIASDCLLTYGWHGSDVNTARALAEIIAA